MAGNVEEYEHVQNPIDTTEIGNQSHPTEPQNADTQHGWTDPTGGNMDPHYQGDTEPVDSGDVTVVTHFGEEVVGKIDRLIEIVKQKSQPEWDAHNLHWSGGGKTIDIHWEGKTILNAFEKMIDGKAHLVVIYEDMNGIDAVIY